MNNLEYAIKKLGYQGGTVHQIAKELDLDATDLLIMPQFELGAILDKREYLKKDVVPLLTVDELIVQLQKCNGEAEVVFSLNDEPVKFDQICFDDISFITDVFLKKIS